MKDLAEDKILIYVNRFFFSFFAITEQAELVCLVWRAGRAGPSDSPGTAVRWRCYEDVNCLLTLWWNVASFCGRSAASVWVCM